MLDGNEPDPHVERASTRALNNAVLAMADGHGLSSSWDLLMASLSRRADLGARAAEVRSRFAPELILQRWCEVLRLEAGEIMT